MDKRKVEGIGQGKGKSGKNKSSLDSYRSARFDEY